MSDIEQRLRDAAAARPQEPESVAHGRLLAEAADAIARYEELEQAALELDARLGLFFAPQAGGPLPDAARALRAVLEKSGGA